MSEQEALKWAVQGVERFVIDCGLRVFSLSLRAADGSGPLCRGSAEGEPAN